jgi:hypothetical protein
MTAARMRWCKRLLFSPGSDSQKTLPRAVAEYPKK